ncbi:WD domain, G-beta repeat [Falsiruegeria litorea R37]|uniref:WD domain, G-beta repeat n=1 Tax=Falsiruegeria litorea R37 TaxID=1200284 RepID=A0A1Y5SKT0_9RHOB|nr:caspase family protein [Falsiruegeria litorea]SLN42941.1 WD domain, G-beta repeat [Falsiruegeria litorea R37]
MKQPGFRSFVLAVATLLTILSATPQAIAQPPIAQVMTEPDERHSMVLEFSPDGRRLAIASLSDLWIRDIGTGEVLFQEKLETSVQDLTFLPNGKFLAVALGEKGVIVFDPQNRTQPEAHRIPGTWDKVRAHADGTGLYGGNWETAKSMQLPGTTYSEIDLFILFPSYQFDADGNTTIARMNWQMHLQNHAEFESLRTSGNVNSVYSSALYNFIARGLIALIHTDPEADPHQSFLTYQPNSEPRMKDYRQTERGPRALVWGKAESEDRFVVIDPGNSEVTFQLGFEAGEYSPYTAATLAPNGQMVAALHRNGQINIFATSDAPEDLSFSDAPPLTDQAPDIALTQSHSDPIKTIAIAPDGRTFVSLGQDNRMHLWDAVSGRALRSIAEGEFFSTVSYAPDSKTLLTIGHSDGFELWSTATGQLAGGNQHTPQVVWASFLGPTGDILACGTAGCDIGSEQDFERGTVTTLEMPVLMDVGSFNGASVSPDGSRTALSVGGQVILIDTERRSLQKIDTPAEASKVALNSADFGLIVTKDGQLQEFDAKSGTLGQQHDPLGFDIDQITHIANDQFLLSTSSGVNLDGLDDPPMHRVYDRRSASVVATLPAPLSAPGIGGAGPVAFHPATSTVVGVGHSGWNGAPQIDVWDLSRGPNEATLRHTIKSAAMAPRSLVFSQDGDTLVINGREQAAHWDLQSGKVTRVRGTPIFANTVISKGGLTYISQSDSERKLAHANTTIGEITRDWKKSDAFYGDPEGRILSNGKDIFLTNGQTMAHFDIATIENTKKPLRTVQEFTLEGGYLTDPPLISPNGEHLLGEVFQDNQRRLQLYDASTGEMIWAVNNDQYLEDWAFSPDGQTIVWLDNGWRPPAVIDVTTGAQNPVPGFDTPDRPDGLLAVDRFGVGQLMKVIDDNRILLLDSKGAPSDHSTSLAGVAPRSARLSHTRDMALIEGSDGRNLLWNWQNGLSHPISANPIGADGIAFSPDGRLLAIAETSGVISLWEVQTGARLVRLVSLLSGDWAVLGEDGRYDASDPGNFPALGWVLPDDPLRSLPVELFYREFFEPRLLPRLLNAEYLPPLPDLPALNRQQPELAFGDVVFDAQRPNEVSVSLTVSAVGPEGAGSGVSSVKLFRDGQLVAQREGGPQGLISAEQGTASLTLTFERIQLPTDGKDVLFEAYAFNADGVKSTTVQKSLPAPETPLQNDRTAYVISIGVDSYENSSWDLNYASADAILSAESVADRISAQGGFDRVVSIPLVSSRALGQSKASRAHVETVLAILGGAQVSEADRAAIPGAQTLRRARPQDLVYVFFAGHGFADDDGLFHLFLQDIGTDSVGRVVDDALLTKTLDSNRLSDLFRDIQAGDMVLVIDACNSAASVEGEAFKPGPMGSRGLGQLAYDKGMRVLTASQAEGVALESDVLRHGALSYAMFREGLEDARADRAPVDERVSFGELLSFAEQRVPTLYKEIVDHNFMPVERGSMSFSADDGDIASTQSRSTRYLQRPSLFDFTRNHGRDSVYLNLN